MRMWKVPSIGVICSQGKLWLMECNSLAKAAVASSNILEVCKRPSRTCWGHS